MTGIGQLTHAQHAALIRTQNDAFRNCPRGGKVLLTHGVLEKFRGVLNDVIDAVVDFDDFDEDNDPHGEHDFGSQQLNLSHYIDRTLLADMGNQLAYAYRRSVPFSLLRGFLMQVGMTTAAAGERSGYVEAGMKKTLRRSVERGQAKAD